MTKRPDLGLVLAGAGLVVIIAAVAIGFITVGGPGAARSERLDAAKMERMRDIARAVSCSMFIRKDTPADLSELSANPPAVLGGAPPRNTCANFDPMVLRDPVGIEYARIDSDHIRLCADFLLPFDRAKTRRRGWYRDDEFPGFDKDRPAGRYCYELKVGA